MLIGARRARRILRCGWPMSLRRCGIPEWKCRGGELTSAQKQENITVLVDLLDDADFYIRLYTLQLLAAVSENRPVRTQEGVLTAPLGVDRLVGILDDRRDAIRNGTHHLQLPLVRSY